MFRRLSDWLALTSTERNVILFLSGMFLVGAGIRLFQETFPAVPQFDYSASDSTFAALQEQEAEETVAEDDTAVAIVVNINTATKQEMMGLPGIGEVMAERILAYREKAGSFKSVEEVGNVKGIGKKKLERLRPLMTVE